MESPMYNRLLMLPLFTGLATSELTQILAHIHLEFRQLGSDEVIVNQGERCDRLVYVLGGRVRAEHIDHKHKYVLSEIFDDPFIIEPYNMYGMNQQFEHSYITQDKANTVSITKDEFHGIMMNYRIIRTNAMNLYCARIHKMEKLLQECEQNGTDNKIAQFLKRTSLTSKGIKELRIKMEDLADYIKETRLNVSMTLRQWNDQGLIQQPKRGVILIPDMSRLCTR